VFVISKNEKTPNLLQLMATKEEIIHYLWDCSFYFM